MRIIDIYIIYSPYSVRLFRLDGKLFWWKFMERIIFLHEGKNICPISSQTKIIPKSDCPQWMCRTWNIGSSFRAVYEFFMSESLGFPRIAIVFRMKISENRKKKLYTLYMQGLPCSSILYMPIIIHSCNLHCLW